MVDTSTVDALAFYQQYVTLAGRNGKRSRNWRTGEIEYHGSCPWCFGTDRFLFTDTGRYSCSIRSSGCGRHGSSPYWFLREYEGLEHREACDRLNLDPGAVYQRINHLLSAGALAPSKTWQERANFWIHAAQRILWSNVGKKALAYLRQRGLEDETIKAAQLGYIPVQPDGEEKGRWIHEPLEKWGLSDKDTDKKQVWIPEGILIPWFADEQVWKLNIRLSKPLDKTKYLPILGSGEGLYNVDAIDVDIPLVLCESELDALSGEQQAGDMAVFVATGSITRGRLDKWAARMSLASCVLVAYDDDELKGGKRAGDTGASYWLEKLPHAIQWLPWSHDLNDMLREGLDIREWVRLGVNTYTLAVSMQEQEVAPAPPVEIESESERQQITSLPQATVLEVGAFFCSACGVDLERPDQDGYYDEQGVAYCALHRPGAAIIADKVYVEDGVCWSISLKPALTMQEHIHRLYPLAHDLSEYHPVTLPALPRSKCPHEETVIVGKERHIRALPCTGKPGAHGWCEQHERVQLLLELGAKLSYPRVEVSDYRVIGAGVACWERYATLATGAWLKNDLPLLKRMLDQQEALTW